jgi:pyridoxine kinase
LVISSHVAVGAVGGRASVFALERLGITVWSIVTINLPHHPGHGPVTRVVAPGQSFSALVDDVIAAPWFGELDAVLCGYLATPHQADVIAGLIERLKSQRPDALILCDPVIGDGSQIYVPQDVAQAVRDIVAPLADILTPNLFELGWLSGLPTGDISACIRAARALGNPTTIVTSAPALTAGLTANLLVTGSAALLCEHRALAAAPHGTGDLFCALFLARMLHGHTDQDALSLASAATLEAVVHAARAKSRELPLAAMQAAMVRPRVSVNVQQLASQ